MHIEIEDRPRKRLAMVRHTGPYNQIGSAFAQLGQLAGLSDIFVPGVEMIAVFHDDPKSTPAAELRSDAAATLGGDVAVPAGLTEGVLEAGRYARVRHRGEYDTLPAAWRQLMGEALPTSGYRVRPGPSFEVYRGGPMMGAGEETITDLYVPIL